jgi:hypothetical protein
LASLNNSLPRYALPWKGCVHLKKDMQVDVVGSDAEGTEIVYQRNQLFADDHCLTCAPSEVAARDEYSDIAARGYQGVSQCRSPGRQFDFLGARYGPPQKI